MPPQIDAPRPDTNAVSAKVVQQVVQQSAETAREASQTQIAPPAEGETLQGVATDCELVQTCTVPPRGNELPLDSTGKTTYLQNGGATGGAMNCDDAISDPDLALLIDRWPTLPAATKTTILAMVREDKSTK
jgi:hypothetical protein